VSPLCAGRVTVSRPVGHELPERCTHSSYSNLERKARQLSTAEFRDARTIRSDTPRDVIGVAALEQGSERVAQLRLERRDWIDSRREAFVSHGATLNHATHLVVIKRTQTSPQEATVSNAAIQA
jgi:hypothetical protein